MSKKLYAEQVIRILSGGDRSTDSDLDIREIELAIGPNADTLHQTYLMRYNNSRQNKKFRVPRESLRKVTVTLTNNKGELKGADSPITLPNNRTIFGMQTEDKVVDGVTTPGAPIYPITTSKGILAGLESSSLEGEYGYTLNNNVDDQGGVEIEIHNVGTATVDEVSVFVVPSSRYATSTQNLIFPAHLVNELIQMTVKQFGPHKEIEKDVKQDNIDN